MPLQLSLQKTCSSAIGRLAATLIRGPVVDVQEAALEPWLQSPLLIGGLDAAASATFSDTATPVAQYRQGDTKTGAAFAVSAAVTPAKPPSTFTGSLVSAEEEKLRPLNVAVTSDIKTSTVSKTKTVQQMERENRKESINLSLSWADAWRKVLQTSDPPDNGSSHETGNGYLKTASRDVSLSDGEGTPSMEVNDTAVAVDETTLFLFDLCRVGSSLLEGSSTDISAAMLLPWLERIAPEPSSLRTVLERSGSYSFPQCEFPFIACLLKHSGLVREAMSVLQALKEGKEGDNPSSDMIAMWKRVQQLRTFLRQQRQKFKAMNSTTTATGTGTGITSSTSNAATIVASSARKGESSPVIPPGPSSLSTLARIFASDGETAGEVVTAATAASAPANPPRGSFEITTISEGDTSSSNAAHADSSTDDSTAILSPVPSTANAALVAEIMAGESVLYHDSDGRGISWCPQPEDTMSVYLPASGYRCTVLSFGEMYDNAFAYVRFAVHGDGSLGPLQAPGQSTLTLSATGRGGSPMAFSNPDVFYTRYKPVEEIVGCLRFSLGIDSTGADVFDTMLSIVSDETLVVTFNYGTGGYSCVVLRVTGAAARAADTATSDAELLQDLEPTVFGAQHEDDDVKVDSVPLVGDADGGPKSFDEVCTAVQAKALFLLRVAPARGCLDADGAKSKAALLSLMDHYTVLGSSGYNRGGSMGGASRPSRMMRWKSFDGQDRWRRVIEFLRVHTKIRRQISADTLGSEALQHGSNIPIRERDGDVMTGTLTPTRDISAGYTMTRTLSRSESKQEAYGMVFEQLDDALEEQDSAQHDVSRLGKLKFPSTDMIEMSGRARSLTAVDEDLEMYSNGNSKRDSNGEMPSSSRVRSGDSDGMSPVQAAMQACAVFCTCNAAAADAYAQVSSYDFFTTATLSHILSSSIVQSILLVLIYLLFRSLPRNLTLQWRAVLNEPTCEPLHYKHCMRFCKCRPLPLIRFVSRRCCCWYDHRCMQWSDLKTRSHPH